MTTATGPRRPSRHWLVVLLAALTVILGVLLPAGPASAALPSATENRVRVFLPAEPVVVGVHECITAGGHWVRGPSQPQIASGRCVATQDATRAVEKCGLSFSPDTRVLMADGSTKPISQVQVGQQVEATDPTTGTTTAQTVSKVWINHDTDLLDVTIRSATGAGATSSGGANVAAGSTAIIHATQHHPFWSTTRHAFVLGQDLKSGEQLRTDNGTIAVVDHTTVIPGAASMWDLTVTTDHTFYIATTTANVLVHNCGVGGHRGLGGQAAHFDSEELAQLTHQHVGAGDVPGRPSFAEIHKTLVDGSASRLTGQNAMQFEHQGVRVIVNEDLPTRSTAYYLGQ